MLFRSVKVKGTITWVAVHDAVPAQIRLFDRLFNAEKPDQGEHDFRELLNPQSKVEVSGFVEPGLARLPAQSRVQFERHGYFTTDLVDHCAEAPVFNRITGLRDNWGK